jgi:hypothetical protein
VIEVDLARRLRDAGLGWQPADGDRFFIPDRDLDDQTFSIAEMTIDVRSVPGGKEIAFNGAVEWALDAIMKKEVVWLPLEHQLRQLLGDRFVSLQRVGEAFRCEVEGDGTTETFLAATAEAAYGEALLHVLEHSDDVYPRLDLDEL